ncbi:MAG: EamA family transporter, partial [Oscillospiraceae bacterium]|nr:EamA family transporter [Oscillospiraceae bacterium]
MNERRAEWLLASVIVARATSLLFSKLSLRAMGPYNLAGVRFTLAFLVLLVLFGKRFHRLRPRTVARGFVLGAAFFLTIAFELHGLRMTASATTSILENTAIVWVPLLEAALLVLPLAVSLLYGESCALDFALTIVVALGVGSLLS